MAGWTALAKSEMKFTFFLQDFDKLFIIKIQSGSEHLNIRIRDILGVQYSNGSLKVILFPSVIQLLGNKRTLGLSLVPFVIAYTNDLFIVNLFENDKIISQFIWFIKRCDQSGDRVSKNYRRYHMCSILSYNVVLLNNEKYWTRYIHDIGLRVQQCLGTYPFDHKSN